MTDQPNQDMEIAYLALGRLIAAQCPAGFASASLHVEMEGKDTRLWIAAEQPDGTKVQLQPGASPAQDMLEGLRFIRNGMAQEDGAVWRSCVVTLKPGGRFAMEVEY